MLTKFRSVRQLRPRSGYDIIAVIAMTAALGTGSAYAANMITGANVEDGSLTGLDVKDGSIQAADLGTELSTAYYWKPVPSGAAATFTAVCPPGMKAVGGGFDGGLGNFDLWLSEPTDTNTGWRITAKNTSPGVRGLAVRAQCARIS